MNKEWNEEIDSISSSMDLVNDEINVSDEFDKLSKISKEAYDLIKEGKLDEAKDLFYKILEQESENHYALVGLGDISRKKGEFPEAIDFYKRCLDSYHENKYALIGLADVYREMGNYKESIHLWEHFIVHYGVDITVLTRLADSYRKLGDYENAKKFYKQVSEIDPKNSYALTGIGYLYFETRKYEWALENWLKMLEIEPDNVKILTAIGNCHRKKKTFEDGIAYFERALRLQNKNFYALYGLADCYRGLSMHEESLHVWKELLELSPNNKVIMTRLADSYRNLEDYDEAEIYYDDDWQLITGYMSYMPGMVTKGLFIDINTLPSLSLDSPWWIQGYNDNVTIHDKMYTAMGDLCSTGLKNAYCGYVNIDLLETYGHKVEELYDAVNSGTWTLDMVLEIAGQVSTDLNGDGKYDAGDVHGIAMSDVTMSSLPTAFGINYTTKNAEGIPEISIHTERFLTSYERIYEASHSNFWHPVYDVEKFVEGRTLFLFHTLETGGEMKDMVSDYAVLPMPKYDTEQENYRTATRAVASILLVPNTVQNLDLCGAAMESLNYAYL
ncbi:MAG: tetratricopeptide repeat protein [Lentisphaeria bacterium]|nr:tetratricopeptide repeat protein [Lentisphaeria bacterium]